MSLVGKGVPPFGGAAGAAGGSVFAGGKVLGGGVTTGDTGVVPVVVVTAPAPAIAPAAGDPALAALGPSPDVCVGRCTPPSSEPQAPDAAINPANNALVRMLVRAIVILTSPDARPSRGRQWRPTGLFLQ